MQAQNDDVIIRRVMNDSGGGKASSGQKKQTNKRPKAKNFGEYNKYLKIFSILLFFFAVLLLLSLVSYTPKDQVNTDISIVQVGGLLTGDEAVIARAERTHNWLGLVGAVMADLLYNNTLGYVIIFLPFLLFLWAKDIFRFNYITEKQIKRTIFLLIFGILFSGFAGTLQQISWFEGMPHEWSGAIGQFLSMALSGIIGTVGSVIIFLAGLTVTAVIGLNINLDILGEKFGNIYDKITDKVKNKTGDLIAKAEDKFKKEQKPENETASKAPQEQPQQEEKTDAEIIRDQVEDDDEGTVFVSAGDDPAQFMRSGMSTRFRSESDYTSQKRPPDDEEDSGIKAVYPKDYPERNYQQPTVEPEKKQPEPEKIEREKPKNKKNVRLSDRFKNVVRIKPEQPRPEPKQPQTEQTDDFEPNIIPSDPYERNWQGSVEPENRDGDDETESYTDEEALYIDNYFEEDEGEKSQNIENHESDSTGAEIDNSGNEAEPPDQRTIPDNGESEKRPLVVTVNEHEEDEKVEVRPILGTGIHDEEIRYQFPPTNFLINEDDYDGVGDQELKMNAKILQEKLETFKIYIEDMRVTPGPVVTQYEFVPAPGIKISKIENLADDLAMALKARGIRIIAPIPGKGTVGVEIPNQNPKLVRFKSVVTSRKFQEGHFILPLALGKTISGEVFSMDLAKMPHMLVAGATGAGKSVGINTIITSLLYRIHPSKLKFIIIDPKKVEMQQYAKLANHYLAASPEVEDDIITNPQDVVVVLTALIREMEQRYDILASVGQRNIEDYNKKVEKGKLRTEGGMLHRPMPYIVVVIDELADLMLTASKEIEEPITRLAQMARAVGIHLVLATQRPSVDVITGLIKANFPARISYLVAQRVDSRTILDVMGAEQLLGNGDMLVLPNGSPKPVRVQNSFISTDEVEEICEFIGSQKGYSKPYMLPSIQEENNNSDVDDGDRDPLFEEAARLVIRHQQGSVSLIQRRLKVGYARAGRIVDELERAAVVGPYDGSKARQVRMESEMELEAVL